MPCYHPLKGWHQPGTKLITFKEIEGNGIPYKVPCGHCLGCRMEKSKGWALRCMHEASLYDDNSFITLTYEDSKCQSQLHIENNHSLNKKHFQLFMKRLRKKNTNKIKFYHCGEYGESNHRPHYHAILFNKDFDDKIPLHNKKDLYTSKSLEEAWTCSMCEKPIGFSTVGNVTFDSAAYVSRYIMKKQYGDRAITHYVNKETGEQILPEYSTMSRGGRTGKGLAYEWFKQHKDEIYHKDFITTEGFKMKPPKYYDDLMYEIQPAYMSAIKKIRMENFDHTENTPERLAVKKACAQAKMSHFKRSL